MVKTTYRYSLQRGSQKHGCPDCKKRRLVRYIDQITKELLPEKYGRCDRESNCGYHLSPYQDGFAQRQEKGKTAKDIKQELDAIKVITDDKPIFMPSNLLTRTLNSQAYTQNTFIQNLLHRVPFPFEAQDIEAVIALYYLGSIRKGYRKGATSFPFIDCHDNIRAIQIKQFDHANHTTATDFLHSLLLRYLKHQQKATPKWLKDYQEQDKKVSCLFGEHLLERYPNNPVALVEAPKTAIYGTLYFGLPAQPSNLLWLAVYNLSSLNYNRCKVLHRRKVHLFPDLSKNGHAYQLWKKRTQELEQFILDTPFIISDFLEQHASPEERLKGLDLADYLIKQDWRAFRP